MDGPQTSEVSAASLDLCIEAGNPFWDPHLQGVAGDSGQAGRRRDSPANFEALSTVPEA